MTKKEIFDDIVDIMRNDSSSCKDKRGADGKRFRDSISEETDDETFLFIVSSYLSTFDIPLHTYFYKKGSVRDIGFDVRRYGGELYVTDAEESCGVIVGDKIVGLDGSKISDCADKFAGLLYGESEERQGVFWKDVISFCREMTVCSGERICTLPVKKDIRRKAKQSYSFDKIGEDAVYLRFDDFFEPDEINEFILRYDGEIRRCENLIIDVRKNCGGTDTAFFPLIKYGLKPNDELCGTPLFGGGMEINYTERNVDIRLKIIEEYRKKASPPILKHFDEAIALLKANRGRGFVTVAPDDTEIFDGQGTVLPRKVYVLTDCMCGSSGESFVQVMSRLSKVTVVGRPTAGILDYSNLAYVDYGEWGFNYPTSRELALDSGGGMSKKGVPVDVYLPWTPQHIASDPDLDAVLKLIKTK